MVLGGFMFLCEIDPDDIYRWFMEMFVDAYDWVMVPNAYAMSQHADGGLITTKPYFSGSNYIRKNVRLDRQGRRGRRGGELGGIWDALYWTWIDKHADELAKNPRWAMMVSASKRMGEEKMAGYRGVAERYLINITPHL